ncbi:hypothetical protein E4U19_003764 [Claviceps sp. Clav32 group G5]|nr:hypothetical protein E4U19_003764 [Claviceps sp. Clav32 group G5]KAG6045604.1 hypothetical protein E4U39_002148 [Claviceps sp. Clav50 group G5]
MPRFSFSIAGRKKQTVQPPAQSASTSKAHKILGSTPPSLDTQVSSAVWDDAPSLSTNGNTPAITASSHKSELDLRADGYVDRKVIKVNADRVARESSNIVPNTVRLDAIIPSSLTCTDPTANERSRKNRSSSAFRSWYNKSKMPMPLPHQTSSSSGFANDFTPPHTPLGRNSSNDGVQVKAKDDALSLQLSESMPQGHVAVENVRHDSSTTLEMDRMLTLETPSNLSSSWSALSSGEACEPRKIMANEILPVPIDEAPRSSRSGRGLTRDEGLEHWPSFGDDDEQAATRHVVRRQSSTPNLAATYGDRPPVRLSLSSSPDRAACRRQSKAKTSRNEHSQQSLHDRNLLQTSVLMLSSDSEEEDDDHAHRVAQLRMRRTSGSSSQFNQRTSLASGDIYITLPSLDSRRSTSGSFVSTPTTPCGDQAFTETSFRNSVMSDQSISSSAGTWQEEPEYDIQGKMPARRLSDLNIEAKTRKSAEPYSDPSGVQLTPPRSPASADSHRRSSHSPTAALASSARLLEVTEREEMLIAALRRKKQARLQKSMPAVSEENEQANVATQQTTGQRFSTSALGDGASRSPPAGGDSLDSLSEEHATEESLASDGSEPGTPCRISDFAFPTPPSFRQKRTTEAHDLKIPPLQLTRFSHGTSAVPSPPALPTPTIRLSALPTSPKQTNKNKRKSLRFSPSRETVSVTTPSWKDAHLAYDEDEPSPDISDIQEWEAATSPVYATSPWREQFHGSDKDVQSPEADSLEYLHPNSCWRPLDHKRDSAQSTKSEEVSIPRPDSPISPDILPATRTRSTRLSAIGCSVRRSHVEGSGWWGDEE